MGCEHFEKKKLWGKLKKGAKMVKGIIIAESEGLTMQFNENLCNWKMIVRELSLHTNLLYNSRIMNSFLLSFRRP